jgi:hypothetical protein
MVLKSPNALVRFMIICAGMSVKKSVNTGPVGLSSAENQRVMMSSRARNPRSLQKTQSTSFRLMPAVTPYPLRELSEKPKGQEEATTYTTKGLRIPVPKRGDLFHSLQSQVQPQGIIEVIHYCNWNHTNPRAKTLNSYGANLLSMGFRVLPQTGLART